MNLPKKLSIDWLRRAYLSGAITPQEVVEACRKRAEATAEYHAWIHLMTMEEIAPYIEALKEKPIAECPLWGIPFAIKDNIDLKGIPTTAGSPEYAYQPELGLRQCLCHLTGGCVDGGSLCPRLYRIGSLVKNASHAGACSTAAHLYCQAGGIGLFRSLCKAVS